uniref:Retrovirus-related Pol polyprotein from transposon TNT 1-94 n=1 Tax=Tanacetum cinerariifolium TaxID=118510 RepID=A0A6L2JIK6_TANCI|nr:retrovirus-related Pol polyprotein from transposon TNT 1-94 [Tanacetum cinerariifolium]
MSFLLDDQMKSFINRLTAKSTWDDLILYHEGPSDVKESMVMDLKLCYNTFKFKEGESLTKTFTRYKALINELVNDGIKLSKLEINTIFINWIPKKWLSFCQSLRNTKNVKDSELASLFGKQKYEENLIYSIYETKKNKSLVFTTPLSTTFYCSSIIQDFQDSPDDKEDTRSSHEYQNDLEEEYQARALLKKYKRFFKKVSTYQSPFQPKPLSSLQHKPELRPTKYFEAKYNKVKGKLALLSLSSSASKASMVKNKGLIAEAYKWDEEVSLDDNEMVEVKVLMALAEENDDVSKEGAKNGELLKIFMRKHVNTKILKENKNLRTELKELKAITETWLNSSNKVNQCISKPIPSQKKRILRVDQLTEDPSSSRLKDLVIVKSLADDTIVTIPDFLSEEEPKKVSEALKHLGWVDAMQDELNQFARNKVWTLVPAHYGKVIIGSRWVFRNKRDKTRIVIQNKARLVAQGYNQQKGIDYDETFASVLLGGKLVLWSAKKQQSVAMSSAEAKYVVAIGCYANILWIKSQLTDYDIIYEKETKSSSAMDTSLSHPLPHTPMVGEMHKEAQQAIAGPTSLEDTDKDGAHPQLNSDASGATTMGVPSADKATASPAEVEKDTDTNLKNKLVDLLGIDIVIQYYNKKLHYERYCEKMKKRRQSSKIINYDVLTKKGPISLKVYREDRTAKVIEKFKVNDL